MHNLYIGYNEHWMNMPVWKTLDWRSKLNERRKFEKKYQEFQHTSEYWVQKNEFSFAIFPYFRF